MAKKRNSHKSFIKLIKWKVKKILNKANYYTIENYDVLVFIITYLYRLYTNDSIGAKIILNQQEINYNKMNKKIIDCLNDVIEYLNGIRNNTDSTDT